MTKYRIVKRKSVLNGEFDFHLQVFKIIVPDHWSTPNFRARPNSFIGGPWESDSWHSYKTLEAAKEGIEDFKIRLEAIEYNKTDNVVYEVTHD
ncbi:MAG: hypothetical protein COA78_22135 [Blastopirellula sp.]|nr:MAG: hypothetical protein COA78_22135 [Blastopirellula sp.]